MDIARLGTGFGYMIRQLNKKPKEEWEDAAKAVLEHHFDNHQYCGSWCRRKMETEDQRQRSARFYRSLTKDAKLYETVRSIISRFITMERLEEVGHGYDTQINESFNNTASWLAPKNKVYCGSQSLKNRLSMAIGISSLGTHQYFVRLFHVLGIAMPDCVTHFLAIKQIVRQRRQDKQKQRNTKKERKEKHYASLRQHEQQTKKAAAKRDGTYKTGQNMEDGGADGYTLQELLDAAGQAPKKPAKKKSRKDLVCPLCNKTGHTTARSKNCTYHSLKKEDPPAAAPNRDEEEVAPATTNPEEDTTEEDDAADHMDALAALQLTDNVDEDEEDEFIDCATWSDDEEDAFLRGGI